MYTKSFRKLSGVIFASVLLLTTFTQLFTDMPSAFALISPCGTNCNATWESYYDISLGSSTFHEDPSNNQYTDPSNKTYTMFYITPADSACPTALMFDANPSSSTSAQEAAGTVTGGGTGRNLHGCNWNYSGGTTVTISQRPSISTTASWISQSPPQVTYNNATFDGTNGINGSDVTLSETSGSGGSCVSTIEIDNYQSSVAGSTATYTPFILGGIPSLPECGPGTSSTIYLSNAYTDAQATPPGVQSTTLKCPITNPALGWAMCPIFEGGQAVLGLLDTQINNFLYFPTAGIFTNNNNFQKTYDNFRDIGLALLVIAALVMVVSEAAGLEIFAAYTIRKALPRLVIAIIGIALAWSLLQFAITFFDDIGSWTQSLVMAVANVQNTGSSYNILDIVGVGSIATLLGSGILVAILGGLGVFSLLLTALLALFVGFIILSIRWLIILICVMMAPLAIAAYVLPGTERFWRFWRDALLGALLMYPIIIAFLAAGWAGSYIAGGANKNLLALIIFFAPYFMLPFAFRLTTGIMSTLAGGVQSFHGGAFARLKKQRQGITAANWQKIKNGQRFASTNPLSKRFNAASGGLGAFLTTQDKVGFLGSKTSRDDAITQHTDMVKADYAKRPGTIASQNNQDMLRAQAEGETTAEATRGLDTYLRDVEGISDEGIRRSRVSRAISAAKANGGFDRVRQVYAANQLAAIGTGYQNMKDLTSTIARVSHGNRATMDSLVGSTRSYHESSGRLDNKASYATMQALSYAESDTITTKGATAAPSEAVYKAAELEAALGADNNSLARGKPKAVQNIGDALAYSANNSQAVAEGRRTLAAMKGDSPDNIGDNATVTSQVRGDTAAKVKNMRDFKAWGPEINSVALETQLAKADKIDKFVDSFQTPTGQQTQTVPIYSASGKILQTVKSPVIAPTDPEAQKRFDVSSSQRGTRPYNPLLDPSSGEIPGPNDEPHP